MYATSSIQLRAAILMLSLFFGACSLSSDLAKMSDAEDYDAYVKKWAPTEDAFVAVQRIAQPALTAKDWKSAVGTFEQYKPLFPGMAARFDRIIAVLKAESYDVERKNLSIINSEYNEIKPSVTVDGMRLYFASDRPGGVGNLDIYVSDYKDGGWQTPVNIGERINTKEHETINGISFDGTKIFIYGGFAGHLGNGDNYYFEKTPRGWSNIMHFPPLVNSKFYDSDAFMTADGFAVLFTSDREGVIGDRVPKNTPFHGGNNGNTDIFVSVRRGNYWQPPINLGPTINTPYAERSPFLHPDGVTLYFSSDAHAGLGKMDVYKSVRLRNDSWTEWSEPVNLGKDVNTPEDDWGYKITPDGKYAFFATADLPGGKGQNDIYMITLPRAARPEAPVATITGEVRDDQGRPIGVDLFAQRLSDGEVVGIGRSDPETGAYMLTLPPNENYAIIAEKEGFYPDARNLDLRNRAERDGSGRDGSGQNGDGRDGSGRDGSGQNGDGRDGSGRDGNGRDGNGRDGSGQNGDGRDGSGRDGSGRDSTGRNGDGRDGSGRDGSGRDGSGQNGDGRDGSGRDGSGQNGDGRDGSGRDGSGRDGSGRDGNGDDGDGRDRFAFNFNLRSVESMRSTRDKWGDLLAQGLNNIFFDFNKSDLKPESFFELERLIRFLSQHPELRIVVVAHTDDVGSDDYNFELSNRRAASVVKYLEQKGVDNSRLESLGYGETRPQVPNDSEENRALNRRVEFRLAE
ncbi:MAG TPA: OmpA family protein [Bacteroidota bacterium]|nr:OmpA family protein [Bacteroidota bacterium]